MAAEQDTDALDAAYIKFDGVDGEAQRGAGKVGATDMRDLPDPEDEVYVGAGKVGATDMRDLPDPDDEIYDGPEGNGGDPERETAVPDPVGGEDAEGPVGLRSDGELVQASDARDAAGTEGSADGNEEDTETALPRSGRSPGDMGPGIEGSDVSTG